MPLAEAWCNVMHAVPERAAALMTADRVFPRYHHCPDIISFQKLGSISAFMSAGGVSELLVSGNVSRTALVPPR